MVKTLFLLAHKEKKQTVGAAEITTMVNRTLEQCGELLALTPRGLGSILRALGFNTQRFGGGSGRGIVLLNFVRRRIHKLAADYRILADSVDSEDCEFCDELCRKEPGDDEEEQELVNRLNRLTSEQLENPLQYE